MEVLLLTTKCTYASLTDLWFDICWYSVLSQVHKIFVVNVPSCNPFLHLSENRYLTGMSLCICNWDYGNANAFETLLLKEGSLLDISSHILFSPLQCKIPLPGFEGYRICVSGFDNKERLLLRNVCHVLGVDKYVEKLTKKVTHLLSKFADGNKYEAACRWGIHVVTADWIYECAKQVLEASRLPFSSICFFNTF